MLHILTAQKANLYKNLVHQMYKLRAEQFAGRRKWNVEVTDSMEIDKFDQLNPLYIMVSDGNGTLLASLRLLQTTGPHMLSEVFPAVMGDCPPLRSPLIWESSRFCVNTKASKAICSQGVNLVTKELLWGLFTTAKQSGMHHVVSVFDVYVERVLRRAGCIFVRLGPVVEYDNGLKTVAGLFEVSDRVLDNVSSGLGGSLSFTDQPSSELLEYRQFEINTAVRAGGI